MTTEFPPSLNKFYRTFRGRILISAEGRAYKLRTALKLKALRIIPLEGPICVSLTLYRPQKRGDADNALKCLFDACNGLLWLDDSQIVEIHLWRKDDKANPRVELSVSLVT